MSASSVKNFSGASQRLKEIRDEYIRSSKEVVGLWNDFVSHNRGSLTADKWLVLEQVFIAALDVGDTALAREIFKSLNDKFEGSNRLLRLRGMYYEAFDQYDKAEEVYKSILEKDPVDSATQKRMASLCKAQGKTAEAVQILNKYLEINCMDFEGWLELSELYLNHSDYEKAAFCVEELILNNPNNHLYHQRYAEIKYSVGDFETARSYFAQAYKLSNANVRALYGTVLCSQKLAAGKSKAKSDNIKIAEKALNALNTKYENSPTQNLHQSAMDSVMGSIK